jgi:putative CocE/NonD family hydrolase
MDQIITVHFYEVVVERDVPFTMRDGIVLYCNIYYPVSDEKHPALLMRTPYGKDFAGADGYYPPEWYARQGYIIVIQDTRGRFQSEGEFKLYKYEVKDGADTVQFVKNLPQCNGRVGMYGFSYVGATQLQAATERPAGLEAIIPAFTNDGFYEDWTYKNGALHLAFTQWWSLYLLTDQRVRKEKLGKLRQIYKDVKHVCSDYDFLPLNEHPKLTKEHAPHYHEMLDHPTFDEYWNQWHLGPKYQNMETPAMHIVGWYDIFVEGTIRNFKNMSEKTQSKQKLVIGPWYHVPWNNLTDQADNQLKQWDFIDEIQIKWFDYWLKNHENGFMNEPPIAIYVMGENKWRQENEWPLARTQFIKFYLHSQGRANSLKGDGILNITPPNDEPSDIYIYNPLTPVISLGGHSCCDNQISPMGPQDQRSVEVRKDVLVYSTLELEEETEVTGPIEIVLYASSDANDTDFTAKLLDVYPDGKAINLVEGIQRASFRNSNETPTPIEPGKVYGYKFQIGTTSNLFKKGHRIRVEISSSNFPTFERNLNVFNKDKNGTYFDIKDATQKIFHNKMYPSHIILPIIPKCRL